VAVNPDTVQLAVNALIQILLESPNHQLRSKAAECLGQLGNESALPMLCQALSQEQTLAVQLLIMDAIVTLAKPGSDKTMSETPKYDFRGANIGNFADTVQSGSRQESTQHIYAPDQNFDEFLDDYKQFIYELQQKYPTQPSESQLQQIIDVEFQEIQKMQPQRWQNFLNLKRLWNGGKKATFKMGEHFTEENLWGKMAIAFLEGVTEDD
jgi:hypothetical protein